MNRNSRRGARSTREPVNPRATASTSNSSTAPSTTSTTSSSTSTLPSTLSRPPVSTPVTRDNSLGNNSRDYDSMNRDLDSSDVLPPPSLMPPPSTYPTNTTNSSNHSNTANTPISSGSNPHPSLTSASPSVFHTPDGLDVSSSFEFPDSIGQRRGPPPRLPRGVRASQFYPPYGTRGSMGRGVGRGTGRDRPEGTPRELEGRFESGLSEQSDRGPENGSDSTLAMDETMDDSIHMNMPPPSARHLAQIRAHTYRGRSLAGRVLGRGRGDRVGLNREFRDLGDGHDLDNDSDLLDDADGNIATDSFPGRRGARSGPSFPDRSENSQPRSAPSRPPLSLTQTPPIAYGRHQANRPFRPGTNGEDSNISIPDNSLIPNQTYQQRFQLSPQNSPSPNHPPSPGEYDVDSDINPSFDDSQSSEQAGDLSSDPESDEPDQPSVSGADQPDARQYEEYSADQSDYDVDPQDLPDEMDTGEGEGEEVEEEDEDDEADEADEEELELDMQSNPVAPGLKEISNLGRFTVSTYKPGSGVAELRSDDLRLFWQSDGPQPHKLTVYFTKRVGIRDIRFFVDYNEDESYTPTKIHFKSGTSENNLFEFASMEMTTPSGWQQVPVAGAGGGPDGNTLYSYVFQMVVLANHQNGKDTHLRGIKIFAADTEQSATGSMVAAERASLSSVELDDSAADTSVSSLVPRPSSSSLPGLLPPRPNLDPIEEIVELVTAHALAPPTREQEEARRARNPVLAVDMDYHFQEELAELRHQQMLVEELHAPEDGGDIGRLSPPPFMRDAIIR